MTRALAAGIPPTLVAQIFDAPGCETAEGFNPTSMTALYPQMPYFASYYPAQYGQYGTQPSVSTEGDQSNSAVYGPVGHVHPNVGQYQYPQMASGQYPAGYAAPASYVYPTFVTESSTSANCATVAEARQ